MGFKRKNSDLLRLKFDFPGTLSSGTPQISQLKIESVGCTGKAVMVGITPRNVSTSGQPQV